MKKHRMPLLAVCMIIIASIVASCSKSTNSPAPRTVQYVLYTKKDFSTVFDTIRFQLLMKAGTQILLDSPLAPMRVADIPDSMHRLIFTKQVPPAYNNTTLVVGFLYAIDNVGSSWNLDSSAAGQRTKTVEYNFQ